MMTSNAPPNEQMTQRIIAQTKTWIESVVIGCNFCPFAARVYQKQQIRYEVTRDADLKTILSLAELELEHLEQNPATETSLLIFSEGFQDFDQYLSLVKHTEKLLYKKGYEGIYQIASFHPDYCFHGAGEDDAANYTNRSPYPMLHFLREDSISKALSLFPHPEKIPENNVAYARKQGLQYMQMLLSACR